MPKDSWLVRVSRWLSDYWTDLLKLSFSAILALIAGLQKYASDNSIWNLVSISTAIFIFIVSIVEITRKKRISSLENKLNEAKKAVTALRSGIFDYTTGKLGAFADKHLRFGCGNNCHERITLYLYDEYGENNEKIESFVVAGRYSKSTKFKKPNNRFYSSSQGAMGSAWESPSGFHFENDYPCPHKDSKKYKKKCLEKGLDQKILDKLTMHSRLFYGFRISHKGTNRALIMIEATLPDRYSKDELDGIFQNIEIKAFFDELTELLTEHMGVPSVSYNFDRGFVDA